MPKKKREEKPKEVPLPEESMLVCVAEKLLGGDFFVAKCLDGTRRATRIPGKYRRRLWVREGDIVLVAPWDARPESKADLVYRYTYDEAKELVERGVIPRELLSLLEGTESE
ncbi:MAG: translation initiation factor aIF-1A [Fervidicoccaceae archaeon]